MRRAFIATSILLFAAAAAQAAAELQPLDTIAAAAEREALRLTAVDPQSAPKAVARPVDPRLRLPRCPSPLAAHASAGYPRGTRLSIAVRCPAPAWQVYVAVVIHAKTGVVVATRPLAARARLGADDVTLAEHDIADLPSGYVTDLDRAVGRNLLRPLAQGEPVQQGQLEAPAIVVRGQLVTLYWQAGGLQVSARGEARSAAAADGRVRVRNLSSGREVDGVVREDGRVEVLP
ncbi:MAG TPA: flagellar basal body P-ring formation chaperone FlgA [Steroidobacteraceae bacterium]|nr:flagellar basal body P-ring formation chaperone FlgA [Steroidobacteraceae bacterium]